MNKNPDKHSLLTSLVIAVLIMSNAGYGSHGSEQASIFDVFQTFIDWIQQSDSNDDPTSDEHPAADEEGQREEQRQQEENQRAEEQQRENESRRQDEEGQHEQERQHDEEVRQQEESQRLEEEREEQKQREEDQREQERQEEVHREEERQKEQERQDEENRRQEREREEEESQEEEEQNWEWTQDTDDSCADAQCNDNDVSATSCSSSSSSDDEKLVTYSVHMGRNPVLLGSYLDQLDLTFEAPEGFAQDKIYARLGDDPSQMWTNQEKFTIRWTAMTEKKDAPVTHQLSATPETYCDSMEQQMRRWYEEGKFWPGNDTALEISLRRHAKFTVQDITAVDTPSGKACTYIAHGTCIPHYVSNQIIACNHFSESPPEIQGQHSAEWILDGVEGAPDDSYVVLVLNVSMHGPEVPYIQSIDEFAAKSKELFEKILPTVRVEGIAEPAPVDQSTDTSNTCDNNQNNDSSTIESCPRDYSCNVSYGPDGERYELAIECGYMPDSTEETDRNGGCGKKAGRWRDGWRLLPVRGSFISRR